MRRSHESDMSACADVIFSLCESDMPQSGVICFALRQNVKEENRKCYGEQDISQGECRGKISPVYGDSLSRYVPLRISR